MKTEKLRTVLLAAIDRSPARDQVVHTAVAMARLVPGGELHLIHAVEIGPAPHVLTVPATDVVRDARAFLDEVVAATSRALGAEVTGHLAVGDPATRILEAAADLGADLIVVGALSKSTLERVVMGSVSRAVTAKARCAVLVARAKEYEPVPEIEPPCPACVEVRFATNGESSWCDRHSHRHVRGRLHYELPQSYGVGSMFIRPER